MKRLRISLLHNTENPIQAQSSSCSELPARLMRGGEADDIPGSLQILPLIGLCDWLKSIVSWLIVGVCTKVCLILLTTLTVFL